MKIHLCSDLHLEFGHHEIPKLPTDAEVIVFAGDIMCAAYLLEHRTDKKSLVNKRKFLELLLIAANQSSKVIFVPGNHEHYHGIIEHSLLIIKQFIAQHTPKSIAKKISILENTSIKFRGVYFWGATLWTDFYKNNPVAKEAVRNRLNDYRYIFRADNDPLHSGGLDTSCVITPDYTYDLHQQSLLKLKKFLKRRNPTDKVIVVTHMAPSSRSMHPVFTDDPLNPAFHSDIDLEFFSTPVRYWFHGHCHQSFNYQHKDAVVLCNPRGYINNYKGQPENPHFDENMMVEI